MDEDLKTVNYSREKLAREFDALRSRYRDQRDTLRRLADEAPTDVLSSRYRLLIGEIEVAIARIDELEQVGSPLPRSTAGTATAAGPMPGAAARSTASQETGSTGSDEWDQIRRTAPGSRATVPSAFTSDAGTLRTLAMVAAGVALLALVGFLLWKYAFNRPESNAAAITELSSTASTESSTESAPAAEEVTPKSSIVITPAMQDFGEVKKGTRSTKSFVLENNSASPLTVKVARSTCRCLWFEHPATVAPRARANFTVSVDGGRARAGALEERIQISAATGSDAPVTLTVRANVK